MAAAEPAPVGLVLVTGASGYLGAHVVSQLLQAGHKVRGTVRSLAAEAKVAPVRALATDASQHLELVEADLTSPAGWPAAVKGCTHIIHVASPFPSANPKDENELIRPAVDGTLHVLRAAADAGTVHRVVLTSSIASVAGHDDGDDTDELDEEGKAPSKVYSEEDWTSTTKVGAYPKSKTLAERAAWRMVETLPDIPGRPHMELCTICPGYIVGPMLTRTQCTSSELPLRLLTRDMPAVPDLHFVAVDVRDVAAAHVVAMTHREAAGQRFIAANGPLVLRKLADALAAEFDPLGYNVPTMPLPKFALWAASWFDETIALVLPGVSRRVTYSNDKIQRVLGIRFRDNYRAVGDMVYSLVRVGLLEDQSDGRIKAINDAGGPEAAARAARAAAAAAAAAAEAAGGAAAAGAPATAGGAGGAGASAPVPTPPVAVPAAGDGAAKTEGEAEPDRRESTDSAGVLARAEYSPP